MYIHWICTRRTVHTYKGCTYHVVVEITCRGSPHNYSKMQNTWTLTIITQKMLLNGLVTYHHIVMLLQGDLGCCMASYTKGPHTYICTYVRTCSEPVYHIYSILYSTRNVFLCTCTYVCMLHSTYILIPGPTYCMYV